MLIRSASRPSLTGFIERPYMAVSTPPSEPIEAIKFLMEQKALTRKDLEPYLGTRARVSEVLNKKRNLTLPMIKKLHEGLNIPYNCLIA